jgi:hypothetical protein
MELIGTVSRLQIQESSLKVGDKTRHYDPAPLRAVSALEITRSGVVAFDEQGAQLVDVHNQHHPASKNVRGVNGVSFGFTAHYAKMRQRFGPHLSDGIAGENILIESHREHSEEEFAHGLIVHGDDGRQFVLGGVIVAAPCVEFTRFVLRFPDDARPDATVTKALQFLHNGMRGFYTSFDGEMAVVRLGDRVYFA